MSLQAQLHQDMISAMKAKDAQTLRVLRNTNAAIKNAVIDHSGEFTDTDTQAVIAQQVKQLKDAMIDFEKGGRADLVSQNQADMDILARYLPAQLSDEELRSIVIETIAALGVSSLQDMGKVMGAVMKQVQGTADGTRVKAQVTAALTA